MTIASRKSYNHGNIPCTQQGFSLVELAIVLVILGLLAGGVMSGQSLIRAAELRSVSADTARYKASVYSFRDKYFALPGDMANATQFWGSASSGGNCQTTSSTDRRTCDGNADGKVADGSNEVFRFWQHLANAGLIEGQYKGVAIDDGVTPNSAQYGSVPGVNVPSAKISNAGYSFSYLDTSGGADNGTYAMNYGNSFWFGKKTGHRTQGSILKPEEAWNIDIKLDDGQPGYGKVIARPDSSHFGNTTSCTTSADQGTLAGSYQLTNSAISCALMILAD